MEDGPVVQGVGPVQRECEHAEGREVGHGVERAEAAEEAQEVTGAQHGRPGQDTRRRTVVRVRQLGRVEAQVLHEHLRRKHRQEGQQKPGGEHRDDVAEV